MEDGEVSFGPFRLDLGRRELRRGDTPIRLGGRAMGILCELVAAKGQVVSKDALMQRVWAGVIVEDNAIQVHVSALRKALETTDDLTGLRRHGAGARLSLHRTRFGRA